MITFSNSAVRPRSQGRTAVMRSPALARSSAVLFWIVLLLAGLATGFLLAQSARYILGS